MTKWLLLTFWWRPLFARSWSCRSWPRTCFWTWASSQPGDLVTPNALQSLLRWKLSICLPQKKSLVNFNFCLASKPDYVTVSICQPFLLTRYGGFAATGILRGTVCSWTTLKLCFLCVKVCSDFGLIVFLFGYFVFFGLGFRFQTGSPWCHIETSLLASHGAFSGAHAPHSFRFSRIFLCAKSLFLMAGLAGSHLLQFYPRLKELSPLKICKNCNFVLWTSELSSICLLSSLLAYSLAYFPYTLLTFF